ncbi:ankyrin repeat family protein [Orientia chuto str. Dubai]|uniref:Ankyrin repeat family protein n=1 Tax=Orientia chuto str. Dubai TaxID=1359168 RepID=A0A0F3MI58_9RICK|nr:ankyrin repeat domain-containing protein [Candidatus Orientia mediorientalis]KJV55445.1 ankyrin repeat family protein [Orientia chuto str. Dubai]
MHKLHEAIVDDNVEAVQNILEKDRTAVKVSLYEGNSPLHLAVKFKRAKIIDVLLSYNANVASQNKDGDTPLHLATDSKDHSTIMQFLGSSTSSSAVNLQNSIGRTPLHLASIRSTFREPEEKVVESIIEELLQCGANIDLADKDGREQLYTIL